MTYQKLGGTCGWGVYSRLTFIHKNILTVGVDWDLAKTNKDNKYRR